MLQFQVTFQHKLGHTITREIPGVDLADATEYANGIAQRGHQIISVEPAPISDSDSDRCHYCGMPATGFGFFDEPACPDCGG